MPPLEPLSPSGPPRLVAVLAPGIVAHSLPQIVDEVATRRQISPCLIMSRSRARDAVEARQEAMAVAYSKKKWNGERKWSLTRIGDYFGRDHTTVMHGIDAHEKRTAHDND